MRELSKAFEHAEVDPRWYAFWESIGAFRADPTPASRAFSMVIPPPNVTGSLHMGHALNHTLPDIIARWKRMQGYDVLWLPGTDHAGIATQNVVEKQLAQEGKTRHDLGREAFEARVWEWVKQSHGTITGQMRKLGESVDWSARAVHARRAAVARGAPRVRLALRRGADLPRQLHRQLVPALPHGAVRPRGACTRTRRASSGTCATRASTAAQGVTVATTRPETMLGDTAIAVNPDDERYRGRIGQKVRLPIIGRELTDRRPTSSSTRRSGPAR